VQVPAKDVSQLVRRGHLLWSVLRQRNVDGVGIRGREWRWWDKGGDIEVDSYRDESQGQARLRSTLLIASHYAVLAHPIAPDALKVDWRLGFLADLVGQILPGD
jgi:hypothetical protein